MSDAAVVERLDAEAGAHEPGLRVPLSARGEGLAPSTRGRLTALVVAKLCLDLLFVAALAVYSHAVAFHPFFSGSLDHADGRSVRGWVVDRARPSSEVEVHLYVNGRFVAAGRADYPRPDVSKKGFAPDERHGFVFNLNPPLYGENEARVYAVSASRGGTRRTLQQIGPPIHFVVK